MLRVRLGGKKGPRNPIVSFIYFMHGSQSVKLESVKIIQSITLATPPVEHSQLIP